MVATSNVLTLTILPDDPQWDATRLSEVVRQMEDPEVLAAHKRAMASVNRGYLVAVDLAWLNELPETEFERARTQFQVLDSEEAIELRVMLIAKLNRHTYTSPSSITSTARPDRMVLAMQKRAEQADFGVDDNYVACWSAVLAKRDHPELLRPARDEEIQKLRAMQYAQARVDASKQILQWLETSVSRKIGMARTTTQQTIQDLRRDDSQRRQVTKTFSSGDLSNKQFRCGRTPDGVQTATFRASTPAKEAESDVERRCKVPGWHVPGKKKNPEPRGTPPCAPQAGF